MAHILEDRVLEQTTTTGTGALTLAAAVTGFRRFNAVCAIGDTAPYFIEAIDSLGQPTGDYEYGIGTYTDANQLTRTTVLGSSNAGSAVNFPAGTKNVGLTLHRQEIDSRADTRADARISAAFTGGANQSLAANGFQKLPGGLILQWGTASMPGTSVAVSWPIPFPAACLSVVAMDTGSNGAIGTAASPTATGVTFTAASGVGSFNWMAIGY